MSCLLTNGGFVKVFIDFYDSFTVCIVLSTNLFLSILFILVVTAFVIVVVVVFGLKRFKYLF